MNDDRLLIAANDVVDRLGVLWRLFRSYKRVPVRVEITLDPEFNFPRSGAVVLTMPNDRAVTARLSFKDALGETTSPPGAVTWSVSDETLASISPDTGDGSTASVHALKGDGRFKVRASSANLAGESDDIEIDPGAAASAAIQVELTPQASPQAARAVHEKK